MLIHAPTEIADGLIRDALLGGLGFTGRRTRHRDRIRCSDLLRVRWSACQHKRGQRADPSPCPHRVSPRRKRKHAMAVLARAGGVAQASLPRRLPRRLKGRL